jgi:hypothetical protein
MTLKEGGDAYRLSQILAETARNNNDCKTAIEVALTNKKCPAYALTIYFYTQWKANSEEWSETMD